MKKLRVIFCLLIIALLFAIGCGGNKSKNASEEDIDKINEWILSYVKEGITEDFTLPTTCPNYEGSIIYWASEEPFIIDDTGKIVERPKKATEVNFNYSIVYGDFEKEYNRVFIVGGVSLETAKTRFENQFPRFIFEDQEWTTVYDKIVNIVWESSNQEIFTNEGKYIKPIEDTVIKILYTITDGNTSIEGEKEVTIKGKTAGDYFDEASTWLNTEFLTDRFITGDIELPTSIEGSPVSIVWKTSDANVINETGKVTKTIYERYCTLTARLSIEGTYNDFSYICTVEALDDSNMSDKEKIEEVLKTIGVNKTERIAFGAYGDIDQSFGYIYFYTNTAPIITEQLIPIEYDNRPGLKRTSTDYITVHDTANNGSGANAKVHANYCLSSEAQERSVSWHFSVDDEGSYQQVPLDETSYHAGDGSRTFAMVDTGIKATAKIPNITIDSEGWYCINGVKTNQRPYNSDGTYNMDVYSTSRINDMGILCEIGENGNYWMGKTWYSSSFGRIGNYGGNRNSVGIETCVDKGSDYALTLRHLEKLVAWLCLQYNLPVSRVEGHHYFSGKGCPNALMTANYWYDFKNYVALELYIKKNLSNYDFNWTTLTDNINEMGMISLSVKNDDLIKYSVKVTDKTTSNVIVEKSFETKVVR